MSRIIVASCDVKGCGRDAAGDKGGAVVEFSSYELATKKWDLCVGHALGLLDLFRDGAS